MPKDPSALAHEIKEEMRMQGVEFRTYSWPEFCKKAVVKRWHEDRYETTHDAFRAVKMIIGYGTNFVSVCHDLAIIPGQDGKGR